VTATRRRSGRRHRGRELALRVLFELEGSAKDPEKTLLYQADDMGAAADVLAFARSLVWGTLRQLDTIEASISAASVHWRLEEIGKVERAVLRLGGYELLFEPSVPAAVVIDESVELAKAYAGGEAAGYVNGVLGHIAEQQRVGRAAQ